MAKVCLALLCVLVLLSTPSCPTRGLAFREPVPRARNKKGDRHGVGVACASRALAPGPLEYPVPPIFKVTFRHTHAQALHSHLWRSSRAHGPVVGICVQTGPPSRRCGDGLSSRGGRGSLVPRVSQASLCQTAVPVPFTRLARGAHGRSSLWFCSDALRRAHTRLEPNTNAKPGGQQVPELRGLFPPGDRRHEAPRTQRAGPQVSACPASWWVHRDVISHFLANSK